MSPPKPTNKQKRRYLVISFDRFDLSYDEMKEIIKLHYEELFGIIGLSKARLLFLKLNENSLIVRINLPEIDNLRVVMLKIRNFKRKTVSSRIINVSGTLKGLRAKFFKPSSAP